MSVASCTCTRRTARRSAAPPGPTGGPARARTRAGGRARARAAAGGRGWRRGRGVWVEQGGGQGELGRVTRAGRLGAGRRRTRLETYCSSSASGPSAASAATSCTWTRRRGRACSGEREGRARGILLRAGSGRAARRRTRLQTLLVERQRPTRCSALRIGPTGMPAHNEATGAGAREWAGQVCWPWSATWPRHGGGERWISGTAWGGADISSVRICILGFLIPLSIIELKTSRRAHRHDCRRPRVKCLK